MLSLITSIVLITPSGAFSPGPLTASAIALGASKGWRAGLYVAVGHMLFELPYVYALTYLFSRVDVGPYKTYMALAATAFIIYFAYLLLRDAWRIARGAPPTLPKSTFASPLAAGFLLTALNPYFLLWWLGVAGPILAELATQPLYVFVAVYAVHVAFDYFWLGLMATLGGAAARLLTAKLYAVFLAALAVMLLYFGVDLIRNTL